MYYRFNTYLEYKKFLAGFTTQENIPKLVCLPYQCFGNKYVVFIPLKVERV